MSALDLALAIVALNVLGALATLYAQARSIRRYAAGLASQGDTPQESIGLLSRDRTGPGDRSSALDDRKALYTPLSEPRDESQGDRAQGFTGALSQAESDHREWMATAWKTRRQLADVLAANWR